MDSHFLDGIGTLLAFIAFVSVCAWAYSSKRRKGFDEAAQLPFADEEPAADHNRKAADASMASGPENHQAEPPAGDHRHNSGE